MKKTLLVILALLLLPFTFSGCKNENAVGTQKGSDPAEETSVLKIATVENWYSEAVLSNGLPVWDEIEKRTNVKIEWETLPWDEYILSMKTRLATAVDLPDILRVPEGDPTAYGQSGIVLPLEDLIKQYGPDITKAFEDYPEARQMMYSFDGHIYGLTPIIRESSSIMPLYWTIRKDWLDKLGLKTPETLNELYDALVRFKTEDPNGNGINDEIPWGGDIEAFGEAFGLHLTISGLAGDTEGYWADNGKVSYQYIDPRYKEYLIFGKKLYDEGIIEKDYGVPSAVGIDLEVEKNLVGAMYMWPDYVISWAQKLKAENDPGAHYIPVAPPAGPDGDRSIAGYGIVDDGYHSISKDCKDPALAMKFLDYLWSDEGKRYLAWGIEGKSYEMKDGKPEYTDFVLNNADGLGPSDALRSIGAWPTVPWIQQADSYKQILNNDPDFNGCWNIIGPYIVNPFPKMLSTKEQNDEISTLSLDIDNYVKNMTTRFIIGLEPIENFDNYVAKVQGMGLDKILKVKQEQYDKLF